MTGDGFGGFFRNAVGEDCFPYQERFARELHSLVNIPTGLGKTAMVVVGWLWRRHGAPSEMRTSTPRRLVYCLPMRVLVEQTRENAVGWLRNLGLTDKVTVHLLMGGEEPDDWDIYPERDALLIGTQDMLLSRALNRGYAASRARWPMQFGLLNTDCLWVFDEVQLMGSGLATTAQLEAFRSILGRKDGHGCHSAWMSATLRSDWLGTVDFKDRVNVLTRLELDAEDLAVKEVSKRREAKKPLARAESRIGDISGTEKEIRTAHRPGTRTIVVMNTVERARQLFDSLERSVAVPPRGSGKRARLDGGAGAAGTGPKLVLLHSRFRPGDRRTAMAQAVGGVDPDGPGTIVVSTQVIEAGVDVSATTLFTELAPWPSLVQRFGRCNRRGTDGDPRVLWIDLPKTADDKDARCARPYDLSQLRGARELLEKCARGVGPAALEATEKENARDFSRAMRFEHTHVIRRRDLIDLFDTTPDLAGNDIDIDRFVREVENSDVRVFWRTWEKDEHAAPPDDEPAPRREELCSAPIGEFRDFAKKHGGMVWRWNFLDRAWEKADGARIAPGHVFLVHASAGGYTSERGWDAASNSQVQRATAPNGKVSTPDSNDDDGLSHLGVWQTIAEHADEVCREMETILAALPSLAREGDALRQAARWHDLGKSHAVFQNAVDDGQAVQRRGKTIQRRKRPHGWQDCRVVAKAPGKLRKDGQVIDRGWWQRYDWLPKDGRKHFRHELASALAVLDPRNGHVASELRDLTAYLAAAHHGKVRMSIRSLPGERRPDPRRDGAERRFARGVWDGDELPETDLGSGIIAPAVALSLEPMELGLCEEQPFAGQPSWAERMLRLRDSFGPFRLAYLEAILRAADMRASGAAERRAASQHGPTESPAGERS